MKLTHLLPLFLSLAAAHAATLQVTSTTVADGNPGSLRAQVAAAASGDTIEITATGTIALTAGEILVTGKDLEIVGRPGAGSLTITTNATSRALHFINTNTVITGITFDNCKGMPGDVDTGGAIAVDNFSQGGTGNYTIIEDCTFTNNQSGWGGAVDIFNGALWMSGCTFSGNTCTGLAFSTNGGGGALSLGPTWDSAIQNCTFSGNTQNGAATGQPGGGAIYNYGAGLANPPTVTVEHCTFVANVDAAGAAGAIRGNYTASYHTAAALKNCLLVNNKAPATALKNFAGNPTGLLTASYTSLGGNVTDESATSAQFMAAGVDKPGNAAVVPTVSATLALNGSVTTKTHAITRGSPAQRVGLDSSVAVDQRGAPRHTITDAGAFELIEPELSVTVAAAPLGEGATLAFGSTPFDAPIVRAVTLTNSQTSDFAGPLALGSVAVPPGFAVTGFPASTLANGQSAIFNITLTGANTGLFNVPLIFTGNDSFDPSLALAAVG
ncbi:MAG: right-handed parallel beta-helix repeat-containing protein, partial [Chthoniobacteraceae bacterium]